MRNRKAYLLPRWAAIVGLGLIALVLGLLLRDLAIDDPYITYRYAANLAAGNGFVYNQGGTTLATTTPLYALLLGALAHLWADVPRLSNALSALFLWLGASVFYLAATERKQPLLGLVAALAFLLFPLNWLGLGFEMALYLLLVVAAYACYQSGAGNRPAGLATAAFLLALATLTRFDAVVPTAILALHYLWSRRRLPWQPLLVYLAVLAPLLIWLTLAYGSPFPDTLAAKRAQQTLGITGFYAGTGYFEGLWILVKGWIGQSPLFLLLLALAALGLVEAARAARWAWLWVAWAAAHAATYVALQVTPYFWYYAPLAPALAWLVALGSRFLLRAIRPADGWSAMRRPGWRAAAAVLVVLFALTPLAIADVRIVQALDRPALPDPSDVASKVLPEAKVDVYRRVGEWLAANTASDATIGVAEVGVIGYYAGRPMLDFLGLLDAGVAEALAQGDAGWALAARQPDYVALTAVNPLFGYDLHNDALFRALYEPVVAFDDPRFWGSPVTVYRRQVAATAGTESVQALDGAASFADQIELEDAWLPVAVVEAPLNPGSRPGMALTWRALAAPEADYQLFVHLVGEHDLIVAQADLPLLPDHGVGGYTSSWQAGATYTTTVYVPLPSTAATPDTLKVRLGVYDGASGKRLQLAQGGDAVTLEPTLRLEADPAGPLPVDFGGQVGLIAFDFVDGRLLRPGELLALRLDWQALGPIAHDYTAFVHLVNRETGDRIAQQDAWPDEAGLATSRWTPGELRGRTYRLALPADAPEGTYDVWVGLYDADGARVPVQNRVGVVEADHLLLAPVRVSR